MLTKADQVKAAELAERIAAIETALKKRPAAFPQVLTTSSRNGAGIAGLARRDRAAEGGARLSRRWPAR